MSKPTKPKLTAKQRRFCNEYLIDLNATQAAIRSGYSKKTAQAIGWENLSKPLIQEFLQERLLAREKRLEITQDSVAQELAKIGFANMADYMKPGSDGDPILDFSLLSRDQAAALSEVTVDTLKGADSEKTIQRVKFKLADKRAALVDLGRHLGMFPTKVEHSGPDGAPFTITLLAADKDA